jgi:hypothetical protein
MREDILVLSAADPGVEGNTITEAESIGSFGQYTEVFAFLETLDSVIYLL